jgi:transposase
MIIPSGAVRVLVATRPVDFRKGMDGLAALVQESLGSDPYSGVIYVFRAKRAQPSTFCIPFSFCDDCLSLAPIVRAEPAGLAVSSREGIDMHIHGRTT